MHGARCTSLLERKKPICVRTHLTEDTHTDLFEKLDVPNDAVTTIELAPASTSFSDAKFVHQNGIAPLQYLYVPNSGVRDMGVYSGRSVPTRSRSRATRDGLTG